MECFEATDFDNSSRLITLSAIIMSGLHCNNNKYFLYSFLLLRSTAAYGQRITNKKDIFSPDCLGAVEGKHFVTEPPPFARPCLIMKTITAFC